MGSTKAVQTKGIATNNSKDGEWKNSIRRFGYLQANLDPLGRIQPLAHPELDTLESEQANALKQIYCGSIGLETAHIVDPGVLNWFALRLEGEKRKTESKYILRRLVQSEVFERFLHTRYVGAKRFSLEGLASMIPLLDSIVDGLAVRGVEVGYIGMAHRGRLTTLWTIIGSQPKNIFACFEDVDPHSVFGAGDVKYHLGAVGDYSSISGKAVRLHLASNPSHLEAINPVAMGRTRAHQDRMGAGSENRSISILIHGDAAFAGQGVTAECLNLASVPGFNVGGTIHINANNLIGFTATAERCHSSRFSTDIAKRLPIPIIHVAAEAVDDVWRVGEMVAEYRQEFLSDIVVDLIGYRKFGHNEGDDPTFTSPTLYAKIEKLAPTYLSYARSHGITDGEVKKLESEIMDHLSAERDAAQEMKNKPKFFSVAQYWEGYFGGPYKAEYEVDTAATSDVLNEVSARVSSVPKDFSPHPKLQKLLEQRAEMGAGKRGVDWGMAEQLAFGSLLLEGYPIRVSGQDARRATFNQRHAVFYDYRTGAEFIPLATLGATPNQFQIFDSVLSEAAVLGYEYGYSRGYPEALVCWEAQFGDFVNGAQVVIDQFISAGEDKWKLLSGIVLLLPHGFEGQGPEHSSARLERFLQLCAEDNMQVVQPSTAAQYFHLLRRQVKRKWRKPLIVMTPKSMLRLPSAASNISSFLSGHFYNVLGDSEEFDTASRVIICSGKIVHDLRAERQNRAAKDVAILTLEQLYPFPEVELAKELSKFTSLKNVVWVQDEPANMGALFYVRSYLDQLASRAKVTTVRRSASASPATGSAKAHELEQKALIHLAFATSQQ